MKKLLLCMLVLVLSLALFACGETTDDTTLPTGGDDTQPTVTDPVAGGDHTHSFEEVVTLEPTCTSLGKKAMKCACGEIESEMPLPFAMHDAKDATCTEDSVCATCGKVLVEKYGHLYVDTVVTEATCTTNGIAKSACHRCGDSTETTIEASHNYDYTKITVSNGSVASKCTACGQNATFAEGKTLLKLDFESDAEFANYPDFKKSGSTPTYANGSARMGGAFLLDYTPSVISSIPKLLLSFDFQLVDEGRTNRGESIFSFLSTSGGSTSYNWIVKYYEADHVLSTADAGFTDANSVKAERGKWYNCTALIDTATKEISVYIDGVSIGTKTLPAHSDSTTNRLRIYDAMPGNGTSNPMYDNFKLVELK